MSSGWLDGFDRTVVGQDSGPFVAAPLRLVLHTTEGASAAGAIAAFRSTGSWPHFTVDGARQVRYQHIPVTLGARALVHAAGTVETNRQGAVQIEMVGFAHATQDWTDDVLRWLAVNVFAPILAACGISQIHPGFVGADQSPSGVHAKQRFTEQGWAGFDGICGHQHVPGNEHWDPGAFPIARLLDFLAPPTPPPTEAPTNMLTIVVHGSIAYVAVPGYPKPSLVRLGDPSEVDHSLGIIHIVDADWSRFSSQFTIVA